MRSNTTPTRETKRLAKKARRLLSESLVDEGGLTVRGALHVIRDDLEMMGHTLNQIDREGGDLSVVALAVVRLQHRVSGIQALLAAETAARG